LPATVGVRVVVPGTALLGDEHPLLATAGTGVAVVEAVVPPAPDVVLVGPEVVVDEVPDPPHDVAATTTATITTPHHPLRRLRSPCPTP